MPPHDKFENTPANAMLRDKYAQDDEWIRGFLTRAQIGHVASLWEQQPFITPMLFWYDPERHEIYLHSYIRGRMRNNIEHNPEVCFEASEFGRLLPASTARGFGLQYESVVAFGRAGLIEDPGEQRRVLYGLIEKYFPSHEKGVTYEPITSNELNDTSVFAIAISSWSGKRNWKD